MAASTAEYIGELVLKLLGMNADRKREVADYMDDIASTLEKFEPALRAGTEQHNQLWALAVETQDLAETFAETTADVLPATRRTAHTERLQAAFNAKSLIAGNSAAGQQVLLRRIAENAGAFRAAAKSLRGAAGKFG